MRRPDWLSTPAAESVVVALAVTVAYLALRLSPLLAVGAFHDDAVYLALGKAIASGEGYRSIYAVGQPVHLKYPPGLPLIYATLWATGANLNAVAAAAQLLAVGVSGATAGLLWFLARTRLGVHPVHAAIWVVGPFLLEGSIQYFNLAIAEPYFMLGWALALVLSYQQDARTAGRQEWRSAAALGLVLAGTTLFRMQAIVMIPAFLLALAIQRARWQAVAVTAGTAALPILGWRLLHARMVAGGYVSSQPDELPYGAWLEGDGVGDVFTFLGRSLGYNWSAYWDGFPGYVSDAKAAGVAILATCLVLAVAGGVQLVRRHPAIVLSVAATVAIIMVWPWPQDRFVLAFLPFVGFLIATVTQAALTRAPIRLRRAGYATLGLLVLAISGRQIFMRSLAYGTDNPRDLLGFNYAGYFLLDNSRFVLTVSQWVRERTEPQARLLVEAPAGIYLYTGRRAVAATPAESRIAPSAFDSPGRYLAGRIRDDSITTVVLGSGARHEYARDIAAFYQRCPGILHVAGAQRGWSVALFYGVRRNDECMVEQFLRE